MFDGLRRAGLNLARASIHAFDTEPKLQTADVRGLFNELLTGIENFAHSFGHYAVPVKPDPQTKTAEGVIGFLFGNRSLPALLAHIDRRYTPTKGEEGQTGGFHPSGALAMFRQAGFTHDQGPDKKPHQVLVGDTSVRAAKDNHLTKVGKTTVLKEADKITTDVAKKIFTGVVHLGAGGSLST